LNITKAEFFDSQVEADWACTDYTPHEIDSINRILQAVGLTRGMQVFEPGCGTGRLTRILVERVGPDGRVLALDISSKMIEICRRSLAVFRNAEVRCAAVEDLSLEDEKFDLVICHNVFPHFDCKRKIVSHLASALRPRGKFIISHFENSAAINELHSKLHPSIQNDLLPPEPEMREILASAGFQIELLQDNHSGYLISATRA